MKENGVQLKIPALDKRWVETRAYTKYRSFPTPDGKTKISEAAEIDEWLNDTEWFNKDLEFLLGLKHFRFWSHLVYEPQCMTSVLSFLQEATPFYRPIQSLTNDERVLNIYSKILRNILAVICRIITQKESDSEWIAHKHHQELIYKKFLISMPIIFDLITIYGRTNCIMLQNIVQTVFLIEPNYKEDLKWSIQCIDHAFQSIQNKMKNEVVAEGTKAEQLITSFDDLAIYGLDCSVILSIFLEMYPETRKLCLGISMEESIAKFYENTIPSLYKDIYNINPVSISLEHINVTRMELLKAFKAIVILHIENVFRDPDGSLLSADAYISTLALCAINRTFVTDYQKQYPVENDFQILRAAVKDLDIFRADFVEKSYTIGDVSYISDLSHEPEYERNGDDDSGGELAEEDYENAAACLPPTPRNIEKEVQSVLDVLPHLGDGFIRRLLLRYDNEEHAISAIFEDNLPPDLVGADKTEAYIPPDIQDKVFYELGVRRNNIFDGDEFDIMTTDKPSGIMKRNKGFPGQPKNLQQLLNDKSHVKDFKGRYMEYSLVTDDHEHDDEYDDSYDALAESESKTNKSRAMRNAFANEIEDTEESSEEEPEDDFYTQTTPARSNLDFCENPEIVRARYEERRATKMGARSGGASSKNVVGNAKGQGQEKVVLLNRQRKEANKSSKGNHNRKSGASWKRNKGMIPS